MIRGKCPSCEKRFETETIDAWPGFPFCSDRCKLIDLGRWIDGDYAIPGAPAPDPSQVMTSEPPGEESDD